MSLAKQEVQDRDFIRTGTKQVDGKKAMLKVADRLSSGSLVWLLVKRHKVAILAIGNIILLLNVAVPQWTEFVRAFIH